MLRATRAALVALGSGVLFGGACLLPLDGLPGGAPRGTSGSGGEGGRGGQASSPSATSGSGAAGGMGGASSGSTVTTTGPSGCPAGTKLCGTVCVGSSDPATGCAGPSCTPCSSNHATAGCSADGACIVMACEASHEDCNQDASDGCEVDTTSDVGHCSSCDKACPSPANTKATCAGSQCSATCTGTFADCSSAEGCETNLDSSTGDCGGCHRACSTGGVSTATCAGGLCTSACLPGRGNCSMPAAPAGDDGCETDLTNTPTACGACGHVCPSGFNCLGSNCGCAANSENCKGGATQGSIDCVGMPGADLCKCGNTLCAYGQRCVGNGVCG